ncbi:MAG: hypothetical protein U9P81_11090 [Euryarchaeota archaeon]|nr:hypothetical protein [Euryarchaeota archaeon]
MSENIKVCKEDKQIFDMLQAELTFKTGKKITQQELFSNIIKFTRYKKTASLAGSINYPFQKKRLKSLKDYVVTGAL